MFPCSALNIVFQDFVRNYFLCPRFPRVSCHLKESGGDIVPESFVGWPTSVVSVFSLPRKKVRGRILTQEVRAKLYHQSFPSLQAVQQL
jgi:hypothetical protein